MVPMLCSGYVVRAHHVEVLYGNAKAVVQFIEDAGELGIDVSSGLFDSGSTPEIGLFSQELHTLHWGMSHLPGIRHPSLEFRNCHGGSRGYRIVKREIVQTQWIKQSSPIRRLRRCERQSDEG